MNKNTPSIEEHTRIMNEWLEAWNVADADKVASFYADRFEYTDPTVPQGITSKDELVDYLRLIFRVWPRQRWTATRLIPHAEAGAFSAEYTFSIANENTSIEGSGMDRIEFEGNKVRLNHVYLNAGKWKEWISAELKGGDRK